MPTGVWLGAPLASQAGAVVLGVAFVAFAVAGGVDPGARAS